MTGKLVNDTDYENLSMFTLDLLFMEFCYFHIVI